MASCVGGVCPKQWHIVVQERLRKPYDLTALPGFRVRARILTDFALDGTGAVGKAVMHRIQLPHTCGTVSPELQKKLASFLFFRYIYIHIF
jgi:hypothetical protein